MSTRIEPNLGISTPERKKICEGLSRLLADTYTLYVQTHNFHWNVKGPFFNQLHTAFENQYTELATAVDDIAERIRALGEHAPGTFEEFLKLSSFKQEAGAPDAQKMQKILLHGHECCVRTARETFPIAAAAHDEPTCDFLNGRMEAHEKTAWMLRASLEG